jgi:hypothetical protein
MEIVLVEKNDTKTIRLLLLVYSFIFLPFIICNFYYANYDVSCQNNRSKFTSLTIGIWFHVTGIFLLISYFIKCYTILNNILLLNKKYIIALLLRLFLFFWQIIGFILFWNYFHSNICKDNIIGFSLAQLFFSSFYCLKPIQ